jgi:hypothetical protein
MPFNEIESHPFLQVGESISANKMVVGTFPIYSLTNPRNPRKSHLQQQRNDISFFYGSRSNYFWSWYKQYIDNQVNIQQPTSIIASLQQQQIAISDVIRQCTRKDESFNDSDLKQIQWNTHLATIIEERIDKIICTSKSSAGAMGWLRDKILIPSGFIVNQAQTNALHQQLLNAIPQSNTNIIPVTQVLTKANRRVNIVALPSPGSPSRRIVDFGYRKNIHTTTTYLDQYLTQSFNWFTQR